ncbi:hypothetical protein Drorol1_Dr00026397 [Drosera rotundifolia]
MTPLEKEIRKVKAKAKEHSDKIDVDDSDELWSVWSRSDEEKTLWTASEQDEDYDEPKEAYPNEKSDAYIDRLFEFEEPMKRRTLAEALKEEDEPEEISLGKKARKLRVENALKKLKKGPDGRYTNVWEAKMRDPNYKFSPELKLKPKTKFVAKKKWQKAQSRRRKDQKRRP